MEIAVCVVALTAAYPVWRAWRAERGTTLRHVLPWAATAWAAWVVALWTSVLAGWEASAAPRLVAFGLTCCAAVAVLGARRPGAGPWHFVLVGLLALVLMPLAWGRGQPRIEPLNAVFMAGVVLVGVLNYLPTRLAPLAVWVGASCGVEVAAWFNPQPWVGEPVPVGPLLCGLAPWVAFAELSRRRGPSTELDRLWLRFRDRFGLVWGQRLREQFNNAATNAGWPVRLYWRGVRRPPGTPMPGEDVQTQIVAALRALLTRFESESVTGRGPGATQ